MMKLSLRFLFFGFSFFLGVISIYIALVNGLNGFDTMDQRIVRLPLLFTHIFSASIALILLALQFLFGLKNRRKSIHKTIGYSYVFLVISSGISAALLAPYSDTGSIAATGFFCLAITSIATIIFAILMAISKNITLHRKWMIRSATCMFAGITLRVYLSIANFIKIPFAIVYPVVAWISWTPNLLVMEYYLFISNNKNANSIFSIK